MLNVIFIVFGIVMNSFTAVPFSTQMRVLMIKSCKIVIQIFVINVLSLVGDGQFLKF